MPFFSFFLSISNGHFPDELGQPVPECLHSGFCWKELRMMEVVVTTGTIKLCKVPVKSTPPSKQHPTFCRPDALPVAQPTVSRHWMETWLMPCQWPWVINMTRWLTVAKLWCINFVQFILEHPVIRSLIRDSNQLIAHHCLWACWQQIALFLCCV